MRVLLLRLMMLVMVQYLLLIVGWTLATWVRLRHCAVCSRLLHHLDTLGCGTADLVTSSASTLARSTSIHYHGVGRLAEVLILGVLFHTRGHPCNLLAVPATPA